MCGGWTTSSALSGKHQRRERVSIRGFDSRMSIWWMRLRGHPVSWSICSLSNFCVVHIQKLLLPRQKSTSYSPCFFGLFCESATRRGWITQSALKLASTIDTGLDSLFDRLEADSVPARTYRNQGFNWVDYYGITHFISLS